ncbi:MAG: hypothetical protein SVU88_02095 [Candidatus Nanohaloarchaea archaeon]|nr:hypothetical protein [Candidatus Nanohaloarchaea archaeon]
MSKREEADGEVYRLEDGETTYDDRFDAITVAEAKASETGDPVTVHRKLLHTFEPVLRIHPDGRREDLD